MTETRPKDYPKLKGYKPSRFMLPTSHYDKAKANRAVTFIENLRHTRENGRGSVSGCFPGRNRLCGMCLASWMGRENGSSELCLSK